MKIINSGSDRFFILVNKKKIILVDQNKDNLKKYVSLAMFLRGKRVNVPRIYAYNSNFAIIENFGNTLFQLISKNSYNVSFLEKKYYSILDEILKLHKIDIIKQNIISKFPFFDLKVLRWEWNYFMDNFLINYLSSNKVNKWIYYSEIIANVCFNIFRDYKTLIHRDLQSTNILFRKNKVYFIDFQGMMVGNFLYDLASLLEDPYVSLPNYLKEKLLAFYFQKSFYPKDLVLYYKYYKIQRLVQVLGAFAFLSIHKNKAFFINNLKRSLPILQQIENQLKAL